MDQKSIIVENSMEMFLKRGCKAVTMDDIARENGISKRTLYELFKDKTSLLEDSLRFLYKQMENHLENTRGKTGNVIETIFMMHETNSQLVMDLKKNFFDDLKRYYYPVYKKSVKYFIDFHQSMTLDFLKRGQQEGLIKEDINSEIVTKVLIEIGNIMENSNIFSLKEYSQGDLFKEVTLSFIRGLCTQKGIELIDENIEKRFK